MEPNVWSVPVREDWDGWGGTLAAPQPPGVMTWGWLQPWRMPCFRPLRECSASEGCNFCGEAPPGGVEGLAGSPWNFDSGRVQCEPGSWSSAFCPGTGNPEALVREEEQAEAPPCRLALHQPPCLLDPQPGAPPQQEAQISNPEHLGQGGGPAAPSWWRRVPVLSGLLERIHSCLVFSFPPTCCPSVFGYRDPQE